MIFHKWVGDEKRKTPVDFEVNRSKSFKLEIGIFCPVSILRNPLLERLQI
jgi:hypothetical protein